MPTTSINDAREDIYQRWIDQWGVTTTYTFEGEAFTEPASGSWARVSVRQTSSDQETLGLASDRRFLRRGRIFVQVFTELTGGMRAGDLLAKQALDIFESRRFGGVWTHGGEIRETGTDGRWIQHTVDVPFRYEEEK